MERSYQIDHMGARQRAKESARVGACTTRVRSRVNQRSNEKLGHNGQRYFVLSTR